MARDFAKTELLRRGSSRNCALYETLDRRFRARRLPKRGWELTDIHLGEVHSCATFERCQIRVVELQLADYLWPLLETRDTETVTERLTALLATLTSDE